MGSMSVWHWVIVALVVLLLFGKGRISEMMGDLAKGIKSFKKGLAEDETPAATQAPPAQVTQNPAPQPAASPEQAPR
ncbi:MAG: twin-arginine translocase TatA/TatE family subunit [Sandaracinobacteroides sp.]